MDEEIFEAIFGDEPLDEDILEAIFGDEPLLPPPEPTEEDLARDRLEVERYMDWEERWLERQTYIYNSGI